MKKYYAVTSSFYDSGKTTAAITNIVEANQKPAGEYHETKRCDIYIDWFDNKKEALEHVKDTLNA